MRILSVDLLRGGGGVATGGSHFGLRRALFITTFVFIKAKKIFFFSEGSQEFGVSVQFPFPHKSSFWAQAPVPLLSAV